MATEERDLVIVPRCVLQHLPAWQWSNDTGIWTTYEDNNRILLESAYLKSNPEPMELEERGFSVRVDIVSLEQQVIFNGVPSVTQRLQRVHQKDTHKPVWKREGEEKAETGAPVDSSKKKRNDRSKEKDKKKRGKSIKRSRKRVKGEKKKKKDEKTKRTKDKKGKKHEEKRAGKKSEVSSYTESYSYSSSTSESSKRKKRKRHARRNHRRRSRSRRKESRKTDRKGSARSGPIISNLGNFGSGVHEADLEQFVTCNKLDDRTADALASLSESQQKNVMGTDGGANSLMLGNTVRNPSALVMSRIAKAR